MAKLFLDNLDLNKNQILNRVIQQLGSAPGTPTEGQEYYNTASHLTFVYNGTSWVNNLARANHTGTQLASTISDFDTAVRTSRLDQMAAPTADVSMNSHKITGLSDGTSTSDAATFGQLSAVAQGMEGKGSVAAATAAVLSPTNTYANGTLGVGATLTATGVGILTVDGYATVLGDKILVKNEASGLKNGIYLVTTEGTAGVAYVLTRATNLDVSAEFKGATVVVNETSVTNTGGMYLCDQVLPTVGTTAISFTRINTGSSYSADESSIHLSGTTFSLLTTWAGQTALTTLGTITTGTWSASTIALNKGGTGQTTKAAAYDALSPMTTLGDLEYFSTTGVRLAGNTTAVKLFLNQTGNGSVSAAPVWGALVAGDIPNIDFAKVTTGVVPILQGGTGQTTAAAGLAALGGVAKYAVSIGDNSTLSFTVTHNLASRDCQVRIYDNASYAEVETTIAHTTTNTLTVSFAVAPTTNQFRVVVQS